MIVAAFIQEYKIYRKSTYIPVSFGENFAGYIGENGVGKSTIIEALDRFFNEKETREWNVNRQARIEGKLSGQDASFIAPVFLIKKSFLKDENYQVLTEKLSSFFWSFSPQNPHRDVQKFIEHRETLKAKFPPEEYYFFVIGKRYDAIRHINFGPFHQERELREMFVNSLKNDEPAVKNSHAQHAEEDDFQAVFKGFSENILELYSYLYIPVETDVASYTKLETSAMQELTGSDIRQAIINAIGPEVLGEINDRLDMFVEGIHFMLGTYMYKGTRHDSLRMSDLVKKIIEAYFSVKVLHKKVGGMEIPVDSLSSGEKRRALIDVMHSFLKTDNNPDKLAIIAIDEPEASLHIAACFHQFERLRELAQAGHQILTTTHWFGFLPIVSEGAAHSLVLQEDGHVEVTSFDLYAYREKIKQDREVLKGKLPYDISLKSYNDLVQAILSSVRGVNCYNWLICEGASEKIYFEYYFSKEIEEKNLRILSVGGAEEVKKIYEYLHIPMREKDVGLHGKVFCLIDTDETAKELGMPPVKGLEFKRLLNDPQKGTLLVPIDHPVKTPPTEIEDCLEPEAFFKTLLQFDDAELEELLKENPPNEKAKNSLEVLDLRPSDVAVLKSFFDKDNNKFDFAAKYIEFLKENEGKTPAWIEEMRKFINA
ncbi:MAG TPA: AAA family ATPase [Patescibacteria group bacterium]|nr:AAA family ATPase [Patescibacteria group bacterium]